MTATRCRPAQHTRPRDWSLLPLTLNTAEACGLLLCSDKTAHALINSGRVKGARAGKGYVFDRDSLREYITGTEVAT